MVDALPEFGTDEEKNYRFMRLNGRNFRFYVKASHDCHLAFTSGEEETTPMFEVFIGGWDAQASAIRFNKEDDLIKVDTPDIVSDDEFREFWISFDDTQIRVGKGGEWEPFMECAMPESFGVTHVGYTTAWGATGAWKFHSHRLFETDDSLSYTFEPLYGNHFTFCVSCGHDAHLAFTSAPEETQPMYEVFIGGWDNQNSAIRLNKDAEQTVSKVETPNIVCTDDERYFWVNLEGGNIKVGQVGSVDPLMEHESSEPFKPTYVGFCTAWGATGSWRIGV